MDGFVSLFIEKVLTRFSCNNSRPAFDLVLFEDFLSQLGGLFDEVELGLCYGDHGFVG